MPHATQAQRNAYSREYYRKHKGVINARLVKINRERRHERYAKIRDLKEGAPCTDCGQRYSYFVMDFDHRDPATKLLDVSLMVKRMFAWDKVLAEVAKCDLVCVCCHRLRTYQGDDNYRSRRWIETKALIDQLKSAPCMDCGGQFKACQMDFDHKGEKVDSVARLHSNGASLEAIKTEIAKCDLVCANCHRVRTQARRPEQEAA